MALAPYANLLPTRLQLLASGARVAWDNRDQIYAAGQRASEAINNVRNYMKRKRDARSSNRKITKRRKRLRGVKKNLFPKQPMSFYHGINQGQLVQNTRSSTYLSGRKPGKDQWMRSKDCSWVTVNNHLTDIVTHSAISAYSQHLVRGLGATTAYENLVLWRQMVDAQGRKEVALTGQMLCVNITNLARLGNHNVSTEESKMNHWGLVDMFEYTWGKYNSEAGNAAGMPATLTNGTGRAEYPMHTRSIMNKNSNIPSDTVEMNASGIYKYSASYTFVNMQTYEQNVEIYVVRPKHEHSSYFSTMLYTCGTKESSSYYPQYPWQETFKVGAQKNILPYWEIYETKRVKIAPGGSHTHFVGTGYRYITKDHIDRGNGNFCPGHSFTVFVRAIGPLAVKGSTNADQADAAAESTDTQGALTKLPGKLYISCDEKISFKAVLAPVPIKAQYGGYSISDASLWVAGDANLYQGINPMTNQVTPHYKKGGDGPADDNAEL
jgi:hypothetical protein